jgi:predicted regulator of Ras-like GTPase activity (Roadblock/LC7/MglB family)
VFDEVLSCLVDRVEGVRVAILSGFDGMVVAQSGSGPDDPPADLLAATLADLFRKVEAAHREAGLPPPREMTAGSADGTLAARAVTQEYLLIALLGPGGGLGRLRFELRRAAVRIEPELV